MRIAIIRGVNLNKWEMQNYEPLLERHEIVAFTRNDHKFDLTEIKIPIRRLPPSKVASHFEFMDGLEEELCGFDIIYTLDTLYGYSYQAIIAKERYGLRVAVCSTENIPFNYEDNPMNKGLSLYSKRDEFRSKVRKGADFFLSLTERAKEALILEGVSKDKIRVIPWGVDTEIFKNTPERPMDLMDLFRINKDDLIILYIGRYDWHRGIYDIIYAAKTLLDDHRIKDSIKFLLIGSNGEIDGMKWLVSRLGLDETVIIFEHRFRYNELPRIYNLADIFLFPSIPTRFIKEQFGMVLIEAMSCGLPIISTLCGSIPEVVGDSGILVQPNDYIGLANAIKEIILNKELKDKLSRKGIERAREFFSSRRIAERIEGIFAGLVGR